MDAMVVWGNEVSILERPKSLDAIANPKGAAKWEVDDLHTALSSHYDDNYVTVWGGYSVPPY